MKPGKTSSLHDARRVAFAVLGSIMLALAFIGALVPLMPTTIFLILAVWCFGRSSPRLEAWLLDHPAFGSVLRDWRTHRAMSRRAKVLAIGGMLIGFVLFQVTAQPALWLAAVVAGLLTATAFYLATRPEPRSELPYPAE